MAAMSTVLALRRGLAATQGPLQTAARCLAGVSASPQAPPRRGNFGSQRKEEEKAPILVYTPADFEAAERKDREARKLAREDFNQFFTRNSHLFPLDPKSEKERHCMELAARKRFEKSLEYFKDLPATAVESAYRVLLAYRAALRNPDKTFDAAGLEKLGAALALYAHPNAAMYGVVVEACMKSETPLKALDFCAKAAATVSAGDAAALYNAVLFQIAEYGSAVSALQVLEHMAAAKVAPTPATFELFVRCCARESNGVELAMKALSESKRLGHGISAAALHWLARLTPLLPSADDQYSFAVFILNELKAKPSLAAADRASSARVHIALSGEAARANNNALLEHVYASACLHNPGLLPDRTTIDDTFFWENLLKLEDSAEVLSMFLKMPLGVKLRPETYERLLSLATTNYNGKAALRAFEDLIAIHDLPPNTRMMHFGKVSNAVLLEANSLRDKMTVPVIANVERLKTIFREQRFDRFGDSVVVSLALVGATEEAENLYKRLTPQNQAFTLQLAAKYNCRLESK
eukprot:m.33907 g.33907  ORF g.33907 m.33907 type:complete len:524 (-) comp9498_c0_seq1:37-1608(-)